MKFLLETASRNPIGHREIKTIADLKKLLSEHPGWHNEGEVKEFIVCFGCRYHPEPTITIYDDYVE